MKALRDFVTSAVLTGLLIAVPLYLAVLLLVKAMRSLMVLVRPIVALFPSWSHLEDLLALLTVLLACFAIGVVVRTAPGRAMRERIEGTILAKIPGYVLLRGLTRQLAGASRDNVWKPALIEIQDALVPGFIIEELEDGRYAVFVPSAPAPFTGSVYVLVRRRVHPLSASFTQTIQAVTRWGSGTRDLVATMTDER